MNKIVLILMAGIFFFSCSSQPENAADNQPDLEASASELDANTQHLMEMVVKPEQLNFILNGNEKWKISAGSYEKLMKIKQQIYVISGKMEDYNVDSYALIGTEMSEFLQQIEAEPDENAQRELQKVLDLTKIQATTMLESNLQNSQIAVINLSTIYDEVPNYFEPLVE